MNTSMTRGRNRMADVNWEGVIDTIQMIMLWSLIILAAVCIFVLILFDVLAGTGIMMTNTQNSLWKSLSISLATSGLLMALMVSGIKLTERGSGKVGLGWFLLIIAAGVFVLDIIFDALTADYLKYNQVVVLSNFPEPDKTVHWMFRGLIGGLSMVGEAMAVSIIVGMPVLKSIIRKALPNGSTNTPRPQQNSYRPAPQPYSGAETRPVAPQTRNTRRTRHNNGNSYTV